MNEESLQRIESSLGVSLPKEYRDYLKRPSTEEIDDTTVLRDAETIISVTLEYRSGFAGIEPWPANVVYVGDEADACPYVIDCITENFRRINKGQLEQPPLEQWQSFGDFIAQRVSEFHEAVPLEEQRRNSMAYYVPLIVVLVMCFLVIPAIAFGISILLKRA